MDNVLYIWSNSTDKKHKIAPPVDTKAVRKMKLELPDPKAFCSPDDSPTRFFEAPLLDTEVNAATEENQLLIDIPLGKFGLPDIEDFQGDSFGLLADKNNYSPKLELRDLVEEGDVLVSLQDLLSDKLVE
jgi:hypothetical protein